MFVRLTKAMRLRSAGALAVLLLLCALAPSAALAFGEAAAHCLTESDGAAHIHYHDIGAVGGHSHADGTDVGHDHDGAGGGVTSDNQCCGMFCVIFLPANIARADAPALPTTVAVALNQNGVLGNGPDRLYRPPIRPL